MNDINTSVLSKEIVSQSIDSIVVLDTNQKILFSNLALQTLTGYTEDELKGKTFSFLFPPNEKGEQSSIESFVSSNEAHYIAGFLKELELITKPKGTIPVEIRAFTIQNENIEYYAAIIRDVRERRRLEEQKNVLINSLKRLAYMDELTMLPNRRSFADTLQKTIATVKRRNRESVLAVMDIDHFKVINDTYGHDIGDLVLKKMANIFVDCLREEDTVGRLGGEEFGCILPDTTTEGATIVLDRLRESVETHRFFIFDNYYLNITLSIGFTKVHPIQKPEEILKFADIALYQAKNNGRNRIQVYPV
ncbi:MAG: sensor domain-containing diguanylate cyclase [Leptospira bouyouniensis]|uniref:diguanylate cyclase n=1 Tax=Leptospira bouyouniensis TaxID=2484911 RepID=A0A7I0HVN9_9LEPT|nr:sensor domain-containing diguanylate cyclase [Leptospira bouyouniensis]TGK49148.1 sensor domain-containing diguanylate cyclase [Leptospira bouyouniensis]TGL08102.1 sensor domain-containing diguanylate cyclase [Leptospira bouyouniensis]TGM87478.1 sensor domain-containing diguanylate cyclase [Leptospira bouyouniensis]